MTGIVVVTHDGLGASFCRQAEAILGHAPVVTVVAVNYDADPARARTELHTALSGATDEQGVVVLTDLPGATPHNLAAQAAHAIGAPLVSGLNLPMLLKALNHAGKPPPELARRALQGGRDGVTGP